MIKYIFVKLNLNGGELVPKFRLGMASDRRCEFKKDNL